jgi:DNA gyrase/topoisomerase IV subunit A
MCVLNKNAFVYIYMSLFMKIYRRLEEERRMKYLEEKRKIIEDKSELIKQEKETILTQKKKVARQLADEATNSVRMGNFLWHNGIFGFYKG